MPTDNDKKMKFGIFWFSLFLLIIVVLASYSSKKSFGQYVGDFTSLLTDFGISGFTGKNTSQSPSKILNTTVIEEESTIINVVDTVSPAVVSIIVETVAFDPFSGPFSSEDGIGTGFIVSADGIIVTNSHVVDSVDGDYSVVLKDGETYDVETIHLDRLTDLAILEIDADNLPTVELGDSDSLKVGQTAIAIGNALGQYQNTVTVGVVSGVSRDVTASSGPFANDFKTYESIIQTDAALNPGNSGGPLLNSGGQVIGINVAVGQGTENIGFAIPVNTLKPILESFLTTGKIIRPYMGVSYSIVTKDVAEIRRLPEGAFVSRVLPDSPADDAGVEQGDIIVKIDGEQIDEDTSVGDIVAKKNVGDTVVLTIDRGGEELEIEVRLGEAPANF